MLPRVSYEIDTYMALLLTFIAGLALVNVSTTGTICNSSARSGKTVPGGWCGVR